MISEISDISKTPYQLLQSYFKIKYLKEIYHDKFKSTTTKGIDRLSGIQFQKQANSQIRVIRQKCLDGTYRFSPYLELLQSKGRGKPPRVLAIPTIRDRIVIRALKEILSCIFHECVPRKLANDYIYKIKNFIFNKCPSKISVYRADLENFYGTINREILFKKLQLKIKSRNLLALIKKAIETPIVPKNYHRKDLKKYISPSNNIGIPQGLAISNILASIYLHDFDNDIKQNVENNCTGVYYRYVDDILVLTEGGKIDEIELLIQERIKTLKLKIHDYDDVKTYKKNGNDEFEYLGYRFKLPKVTIRTSTIENFLHSIAAKFSNYIHNRKKRLKLLKNKKFNNCVEKLKEIFIDDLNEKITGAISENRKYGWIFYFNAINDQSVLYQIDNIIANLFKRLEDFNQIPPSNLKKISRAFYEARHNPTGGYIHNYNNYKNIEQKKYFLIQRGKIEFNKKYPDKEINELYESFKKKNLSELDRDDAFLY